MSHQSACTMLLWLFLKDLGQESYDAAHNSAKMDALQVTILFMIITIMQYYLV